MKTWAAVLAILGGLAGVSSGLLVTFSGAVFGDDAMASDGSAVFWLSFLGMILGFVAWKFKKTAGVLIIAIAFYGFFVNGLFFIFAFVFFMISGIIAFRIDVKKTVNKEA